MILLIISVCLWPCVPLMVTHPCELSLDKSICLEYNKQILWVFFQEIPSLRSIINPQTGNFDFWFNVMLFILVRDPNVVIRILSNQIYWCFPVFEYLLYTTGLCCASKRTISYLLKNSWISVIMSEEHEEGWGVLRIILNL